MWKLPFVLAAVAGLAANAPLVEIPSPQKHQSAAPEGNQQTQTYQRGTEASPVFVKVIPTKKTEAETHDEQQAAHDKGLNDWWTLAFVGLTAFFTGLGAIIAIVQAGFFWSQLKLMRQEISGAAEATRDAKQGFILAERANLGIRNWSVEYMRVGSVDRVPAPSNGLYPVISFDVFNTGRTVGTITEMLVEYDIGQRLPNSIVYNGRLSSGDRPQQAPAIVFPNSNVIVQIMDITAGTNPLTGVTVHCPRILTEADVEGLNHARLYVLVWGRMRFTDVFGDECIVGFGVRIDTLFGGAHFPVVASYNYMGWKSDPEEQRQKLPAAHNAASTATKAMVAAILHGGPPPSVA